MKKITFSILMVCSVIFLFAGGNPYALDNQQVDELFSNSTEISLSQLSAANLEAFGVSSPDMLTGRKNEWVALILCSLVGNLGIHRLYLGTNGINVLWYTITCGGCGIVQTVDWWVILIDGIVKEKMRKYENNPKFIMWMD